MSPVAPRRRCPWGALAFVHMVSGVFGWTGLCTLQASTSRAISCSNLGFVFCFLSFCWLVVAAAVVVICLFLLFSFSVGGALVFGSLVDVDSHQFSLPLKHSSILSEPLASLPSSVVALEFTPVSLMGCQATVLASGLQRN